MYDLVVVGAGPGGYEAALKASKLGMHVALVERDLVGGTCLNRGCIPTKTLLHTSGVFFAATHCAAVEVKGASVDFDALRAHVREVSDSLRSGIETALKKASVECFCGNAHIDAPHSVKVQMLSAPVSRAGVPTGEDKELAAKYILIATGSAPALPPIEGARLAGVYTSDELLADIPSLDKLVIIGAGVIGLEIASFYAQLGTSVVLIEMAKRALPTMDKEFGRSVAQALKPLGAAVIEDAQVNAIEPGDAQAKLKVSYTRRGKAAHEYADAVLIATGRRSVSDFIGDALPLSFERGRIVVDKHMRTGAEGVWAIGDVAGSAAQLAHVASAQAYVAVSDMAGVPCGIDMGTVPACVYTSPEIAEVGLSEEAAAAAGIEVRSAKYLMTGHGRTVSAGLGRGFIKIVADAHNKIVGASLMCGNATDIVGELGLAIANGITVREALRVIRAHPTFEEGVGMALEAFEH